MWNRFERSGWWVLGVLVAVCVGAPSTALRAGESPAAADPARAEAGREGFIGYCSSCHGTAATGDGPLARYMPVPPGPLTQLVGEDGRFPFDTVVTFIEGREGSREGHSDAMPCWGPVYDAADPESSPEKTRRKIEDIVHFLWTLQRPG